MKPIEIAKAAACLAFFVIPLAGCNIGNAPYVSPTEVEQNFQKLDPQEQIKTIQSSPASAEKKAELIKAIEDKYGIKAKDAAEAHGTQTPVATPPPAKK